MQQITHPFADFALAGRNEPEWFFEHRKKHFDLLKQAPMPDFRHGLSILLTPREFDFDSVLSTGKASVVHNADEHTGVQIHVAENIDERFSDVKEHLDSEEKSLFHYFTEAFANNFVLIKIPDGTECSNPITVTVNSLEGSVLTKVFVLAGARSKAQVVVRTRSDSCVFAGEHVRVVSGAGSNVQYINLQQLEKTSFFVQSRRALLGRDAHFSWIDAQIGSYYSQAHSYLDLREPGTHGENTVLYLAGGNQRFDIYTESRHSAPNTYSNILTQGAVNHVAKALSRGLVRIESNAPDSNGYETQNALLLNDTAEADAIPNLEIENHDVKCSHGSTIGHVDEEQLFYLMSRGLSRDEAVAEIVSGYFAPVLEVVDQTVRELVLQSIQEGLQ